MLQTSIINIKLKSKVIAMIPRIISAICEGKCYVQQIVVSANKISSVKTICKKGEKIMDRLFYITKGTFNIKEKNCKEICAHEGTLIYLPSDVEYTAYWEQTDIASYIAFNYNLYELNGIPLHLSDRIIVAAKDKHGEIYKLLKYSSNAYIQNEKFAGIELQSLFYKLLHTIFRQQNRKAIKKDKDLAEIYRAIIYLEDNYMFEITTESLAQMCNMSVATFRRLFKKYKQTSPMKYRQTLRMAHAKNMLESGVYTVTEVSDIMGCTDLSHFNRQYHGEFGINPSVSKQIND